MPPWSPWRWARTIPRIRCLSPRASPGDCPQGRSSVAVARSNRVACEGTGGRAMSNCLVVAYGVGVDSTAMLIGLQQRGIRPAAILFADTGGEKAQTYAFLPVMDAWLRDHDFPTVTVVRNVVTNF